MEPKPNFKVGPRDCGIDFKKGSCRKFKKGGPKI